jgi:hypothetical protein
MATNPETPLPMILLYVLGIRGSLCAVAMKR